MQLCSRDHGKSPKQREFNSFKFLSHFCYRTDPLLECHLAFWNLLTLFVSIALSSLGDMLTWLACWDGGAFMNSVGQCW